LFGKLQVTILKKLIQMYKELVIAAYNRDYDWIDKIDPSIRITVYNKAKLITHTSSLKNGEVLILENLRFHKQETKNDPEFAKQLAAHADYYINDAFSCSHRSHASITGVTEFIPSYAGLLLEKEVECLSKALKSPERPMAAIVGGSKISTKIDLLYSLIDNSDYIFIGGGMANTFLHAKGVNIGNSLCEKDLKAKALEILKKAEAKNCKILLPIDFSLAKAIDDGRNSSVCNLQTITSDKMILDVATQTVIEWSNIISKCKKPF
jgi:phosphoglycerate kinase